VCHRLDAIDGRGTECHTLLAKRVGQVGDGVFLAHCFRPHHRHAELGRESVNDCQLHVCRLDVEYKCVVAPQVFLALVQVDLIDTY